MALDETLQQGPETRTRRQAVKEWIRRYWKAELIGTGTALTAAFVVPESIDFIANTLHQSPEWLQWAKDISIALGGTWAENIGFYGTMALQELRAAKREKGERYRVLDVARTAVEMVKEFGPGEIFDSALTRPFMMGAGARYFKSGLGVIAGKLVADIPFYALAIISYERRRRAPRLSER